MPHLVIIAILCLLSAIGSASAVNVDNDSTNTTNIITNDIEHDIKVDVNKELMSGTKASEVYVTINGSDEKGNGTKLNPYQSIKHAIDTSDENIIINLGSGNYIGEKNKNILINKTVTIKGISDKSIIDAESDGRIFLMSSNAKLTLINLVLTNGCLTKTNENGGIIFNNKGEINIINCTLKNTFGYTNGGAIFNNLGTLNIINSQFINNSAIQYGGAIYTNGKTTIKNTNFTKNEAKADKSVGGCIVTNGIIELDSCVFHKNFAVYSAGALLNLGNATINNCTFTNLTTNYTGGAVSNHNYMVINNSYFAYNDVRFYAAAILAPPSGQHVTTIVYNTIFEKNHAGHHGAVSNNFENTELYIEKSAIAENYIIKNELYGDIALDENATVEYCWWGQNNISPYYYSPHSLNVENNRGNITATKWLIMDFKSNNQVIYKDEENILTVSLRHYFDNITKETYEYTDDLNLPLDVKFYTSSGTIISTKKLVNGTTSIKYTGKSNDRFIYATINNQTLAIGVKERETTNLETNNLIKYYLNGTQLEVKLTDSENKPIPNKNINILIVSKNYTKTTDENGIAKLNINLNSNVYNATVIFYGDENYKFVNKSIKVTVLKNNTEIIANNLIKYYKSDKQLVVKLTDKNKIPLINKTVTITILGKNYIKKTDEKGNAKLNINLNKGKCIAKISFKGSTNYKGSTKSINITVLKPQIINTNTEIHRNKWFIATFKEANGKIIKNVQVKFTINGKTYVKTTNKNGQAGIILNLPIKSYTIKVGFQTSSYYGTTCLTKRIKVIA